MRQVDVSNNLLLLCRKKLYSGWSTYLPLYGLFVLNPNGEYRRRTLSSEEPHNDRVDSLVIQSQRASHMRKGDSASYVRKAEGLYILFWLKQVSSAGPMHQHYDLTLGKLAISVHAHRKIGIGCLG